MITVLSPAKSLDFEREIQVNQTSEAVFYKEAQSLVKTLRNKPLKDIKNMMSISDSLTKLNLERFKNWSLDHQNGSAKAAGFVFNGEAYRGLDIHSFSKETLDFAQKNLRILSGLYGILKPLDLIHPYRLEMGSKLQWRSKKNLYEFWGDKITNEINQELKNHKHKVIVNTASAEYFKAVQPKALNAEIITPVFKDAKGGEYKVIQVYAKKARGYMAAFIANNAIEEPEAIKAFDTDGYVFNERLTSGNEWVFTRG